MTYRLLLFSEEIENFVMEIMAPPSTTFHELHELILRECAYTEKGNHRFLICDEGWKVKEKIHLHDTGKTSYDEDLYLMEDAILDDFIEENGQHIAYIYNTEAKSTFLLDLVETIFGEKAEKVHVSRRKGTPPPQFKDEYAIPASDAVPASATLPAEASGIVENMEEETFDDDGFDADEIDTEGFEVSEM